ncbi:MAG: rhodanese-like domain-containing protein [Bacteroidota bacterium]
MKSLQIKITLILILSLGFLSCAQKSNNKNDVETIELKESVVSYISPKELNLRNENIQLIDIRTPKEFSGGYLKNAKNINLYNPNFINEMNKLDKNKELYIYCRSGNRTGSISKKLEDMGFKKIYDLKGGILNWKRNNLEVEK